MRYCSTISTAAEFTVLAMEADCSRETNCELASGSCTITQPPSACPLTSQTGGLISRPFRVPFILENICNSTPKSEESQIIQIRPILETGQPWLKRMRCSFSLEEKWLSDCQAGCLHFGWFSLQIQKPTFGTSTCPP